MPSALSIRAKGDSRRDTFSQRAAQSAAHFRTVQVAVAHIYVRLELVLGLPAHEVDRPGSRVATVQGPLRTLEHFHAVEVKELERKHRGRHQINLVHVHTDGRIVVDSVVVQANATYADVRNAVAEHDVRVEIGCLRRNIRRLVEAEFLQVCACERGHRHANVAQRLLALERRHEDLLDDRHLLRSHLFRLGRLRRRRSAGNQRNPAYDPVNGQFSYVHPDHPSLLRLRSDCRTNREHRRSSHIPEHTTRVGST